MAIKDLAYTRFSHKPLRSNSRSRTGLMYCIDCSINSGVSFTIVSELLIKLLLYNEVLIRFVTGYTSIHVLIVDTRQVQMIDDMRTYDNK